MQLPQPNPLATTTNHLHDLHDVAGQAVQELRDPRQEIREDERAAQRVCLYCERLEYVVPAGENSDAGGGGGSHNTFTRE
jgi:hypothetical protein